MKYTFFLLMLFFSQTIYNSPVSVSHGGTGLSTLTAHALLVGNGTSNVTLLSSSDVGIPIISTGTSSNPSFSNANVAGGGTGTSSLTAFTIIAGGTTSTGAVQQISGTGTTGQVLVSSGAGTLPTWSDPYIFQTKVYTLTAAQVNTLNASPITIIPAPGSGKVIQVIKCMCKMNYGGTNVFATSPGTLILRYLAIATSVVTAMANASVIAASNQIAYTNSTPSVALSYASANNQSILLYNSSPTEFTGGTGNTLQISVTYKIITI